MNFLKSHSIRRLPLALGAVAALGFAMTDAAIATPIHKIGDPCTIHSGPYKGKTGVFQYQPGPGNGKVVCLPKGRYPMR